MASSSYEFCEDILAMVRKAFFEMKYNAFIRRNNPWPNKCSPLAYRGFQRSWGKMIASRKVGIIFDIEAAHTIHDV